VAGMSIAPRARRAPLALLVLVAVVLALAGCEGIVVEGGSGGAGGAGGTPKAGSQPTTRKGSAEAAARAAARYGGVINYGKVDRKTGQRSGITATITPEMVEAAEKDELGSAARSSIRPPGFDKLPQRNRARGHLLGRQLGGSGDVAANLVAMYQRAANSPVMRDYETLVAKAAEAGETIRYEVKPLYDGPGDTGAPRAIRIKAAGDHGFRLDVEIANTVKATVKEYVAPG
jgi:DNA/RNA non-specific endonuclease